MGMPQNHDDISDITGTVKWIVAVGASVAGVVVAGVSLSDLRGVASSPRWILAVACVSVALACIGGIVLVAANVLATPRITLRELSARETRSGGPSLRTLLSRYEDGMVQAIHDRRTELLGPQDSLFALYQELLRTRTKEMPRDERRTVEDRAAQVAAAARRYEADRRYRRLLWCLRAAGPLFGATVIGFVHLTATSGVVPVTEPVPVRVYRIDASPSTGPCPSDYPGVAVGGSWDRPVVVTSSLGAGCPARRFRAGSAYVVVPQVAATP